MAEISIIIPIYNVEEYLTECLESVLKLTQKIDSEVIMVDDGSTDCSSEIAKKYAEEYECFSYYYQENMGLGATRNKGVEYASGKYLMFCDSDDMIEPSVWLHMYEVAEHNQSDLTTCDAVRVTGKKISSSDPLLYCFHNFIGTRTHITKRPELIYDTTAWNKLILRSFYLQHEFKFPENMLYEDVSWAIPVHFYANEVSVVNEPGYYWRIRTGNTLSITQNKKEKKNLTDKLEGFQRVFDFVNNTIKNETVRNMLEVRQWGFDYIGHMKTAMTLEPEEGMEYIRLLADFIKKNMTQEGLESIPLIHQQMVKDILAHDMEHLGRVLNYNKANYANAPVIDGKLLVSDEIFTLENRSAENEFRWKPARTQIDDGRLEDNKIFLECHVYYRKVEVPAGGQKVRAYLWNVLYDQKIELPVEACGCEWLTAEQGTVINYDDYRTYKCNYDGSGFVVELDFEKLDQENVEPGFYKIVIEYENATVSGTRILGGVKKNACPFLKGFSYKGENSEFKITKDKREILQFTVKEVIPVIEEIVETQVQEEPAEEVLVEDELAAPVEVIEEVAEEIIAEAEQIEEIPEKKKGFWKLWK